MNQSGNLYDKTKPFYMNVIQKVVDDMKKEFINEGISESVLDELE